MLAYTLVAATAAVALPVEANGAELSPHRAFYELNLAEVRGFVTDVRGAFAVEWRHACEGYTSEQRLWFVGRTDDGGSFDYDVRFSTWESADNRQMRFAMRSFAGGRLVEEVRGSAELPADGGPGRAVYTEPGNFEMQLPAGTVFPSEHMARLIDHAKSGDRVVSVDLFDGAGAGDDALAKVTAVIGDPLEAKEQDTTLPRAWPMALAYHELVETEGLGTPVFELSFDLTADGVMRRALLDYGEFALDAELDQIEMLNQPVCE